MKSSFLIIVVLLLVSVNANAEYKFAEDWTLKDTAYQAAFVIPTIADWKQTRWMAKNNWEWDNKYYHETNIILGKHPDSKDVDIYMPLAMIAHTIVALALPPEATVFNYKINPRRIWQCVWIAIEVSVVVHNYNLGARIEF